MYDDIRNYDKGLAGFQGAHPRLYWLVLTLAAPLVLVLLGGGFLAPDLTSGWAPPAVLALLFVPALPAVVIEAVYGRIGR